MAETPDLKELMRMAQEMQKSMKEVHDDLSRQQYEGEAGTGLVKVIMNGKHETVKVTIDPKVVLEKLQITPGALQSFVNFLADLNRRNLQITSEAFQPFLDFLADLLVAANNAAHFRVEKDTERKMTDLSKKLGIPGKGKE